MATSTVSRFHQDNEGGWVAELACGHLSRVRQEHHPWLANDAERMQKVGTQMNCPLCQMPVLPAGLHEYKRTATFTEDTVPAALLRDHGTKEGVWALIVVEAGQLEYTLEYTIEEPVQTFLLTPDLSGVIPPVIRHRVKVLGEVRFHLELLKR